MKKLLLTFLFSVLSLSTVSAQLFDEATNGDASNDASNPTLLELSVGSNLVSGTVTQSNDIVDGDIDFFTFTIAEGQSLDAIFLPAFEPGDRGFHAINSGPTGIAPSGPNAGDVSQFLGSNHLSRTDGNLLDSLGQAIAGTGFDGPLGPGTYSYIVQQTGSVVSNYTLDFTVVPEPATGSLANLLVCGLALLSVMRRKRSING